MPQHKPSYFRPGEELGNARVEYCLHFGTKATTRYQVTYLCCGNQGEITHSVLYGRRMNGRKWCPSCAGSRNGSRRRKVNENRAEAINLGRPAKATAKLRKGEIPPLWPAPPSVVEMMRLRPWEHY